MNGIRQGGLKGLAFVMSLTLGGCATLPAPQATSSNHSTQSAVVQSRPLPEGNEGPSSSTIANKSAVTASQPIGGRVRVSSGQGTMSPSQARPAWYDTPVGQAGIVVGASAFATLFDKRVRSWAEATRSNSFNHLIIHTRDILPIPAFILAAATSFPSPLADNKLAHVSTVAVTGTVITAAEVVLLKQLIGRDRPNVTDNPYQGESFNPRYNLLLGGSSYPSGHAALTWSLITPYAEAYHAPWLYAFGVASAAGRVMENAHWLSDVVGGSLLGYFTARWTMAHMDERTNFGLIFTGNGLLLFKEF